MKRNRSKNQLLLYKLDLLGLLKGLIYKEGVDHVQQKK